MNLRDEAETAWGMFHEAVRRLDAICMRDNVTLKLTIPILGATKKKLAAAAAKAARSQSAKSGDAT